MATLETKRPKYCPRGQAILYELRGQLCARSWPSQGVRNPQTPPQMRRRGQFTAIASLLRGFTPVLRRGFKAALGRRRRMVGGYHRALGTHLRNGAVYILNDTVRIDYARVRISEGSPFPLGNINYRLQDDRLVLTWSHPCPSSARGMLIAYCAHALGLSGSQVLGLPTDERAITVHLPQGAGRGAIELYMAPCAGEECQACWTSVHLHIDPRVATQSSGFRPPVQACEPPVIDASRGVPVQDGLKVPPLP